MPTERTTDPGVTTGADAFAVMDNNANVLDAAAQSITNLGPGLLGVGAVGGTQNVVEVPFSPDGLYTAGLAASISGLAVSYAGSTTVQRQSLHLFWEAGIANLTGNATPDDRVDLIYYDPSGAAIAVVEDFPGFTPAMLVAGLPFLLCCVPAGEDGTKGTAFIVEMNQNTPEVQQLPGLASANRQLRTMRAGNLAIWAPAGKSEIVEAETFYTQWQHGGGTLFIQPGGYYDGLVEFRLPKNPGAGWKTTVVDVATATGDPASPELFIACVDGGVTINGFASFSLLPGWGKAEISFDGTQYLVTAGEGAAATVTVANQIMKEYKYTLKAADFAAFPGGSSDETTATLFNIAAGEQLASFRIYQNQPSVITGATTAYLSLSIGAFITKGMGETLETFGNDAQPVGFQGIDYAGVSDGSFWLSKTAPTLVTVRFVTDATFADVTQWPELDIWVLTNKLS